MTPYFSSAAAGLGLGIALAGAPGPVQAIILRESIRGGMSRGVRVQLGANVAFAVLLVCLALGLSAFTPEGTALRVLKVAGGLFLLLVAAEGLLSRDGGDRPPGERRSLPPAVRGVLAVILNPGAWLFLATAASSLLSTAAHASGTGGALLAALALAIGLAMGDGAVVLLGGLGVRRAGNRVGLWVRRGLSLVIALLGIGLIVSSVG